MKNLKILIVVGLLALPVGCASWAAQFKADPVAALQHGVSYILNALDLARVAFNLAAGESPSVEGVRPQYEAIEGRVRAAVRTAQDGLRVAAELGQARPDSETLLRSSRAALGDLETLLTGLPSGGPGRAGGPEMQEALAALRQAGRQTFER